ncbi:hypothetical protein KR074_002417 [Drosophila pseudoananassae]|nr:hypothetical protein KR074_002417 [Drosophila pseudoananassae]
MPGDWKKGLPEYTESAMNELFKRKPRLRLRPNLDVNSADNDLFTRDVRKSESRLSLGVSQQASDHLKLTTKKKHLKTSPKTRPKSTSNSRRRNRKDKMRMALKYSADRHLQHRYRVPSKHLRSGKRPNRATKPVRQPPKPEHHASKKVKRPAKPVKELPKQESDNRFSLYPYLIQTPGYHNHVKSSTLLGGPLMHKSGVANIVDQFGPIRELEDRAMFIPNELGIDMRGTSRNPVYGRDRIPVPEHFCYCPNYVESCDLGVEESKRSAAIQRDARVESLLSVSVTPSEVQMVLEHRARKPRNTEYGRDRTPVPDQFCTYPNDVDSCDLGVEKSTHSTAIQSDSRMESLLSASVTPSEVQMVLEHRARKPRNTEYGRDRTPVPDQFCTYPNDVDSCDLGVEKSTHSTAIQSDSRMESLLSASVTPSEVQMVLEHRARKPRNTEYGRDRTPVPDQFCTYPNDVDSCDLGVEESERSAAIQSDSRMESLLSASVTPSEVQMVLEHSARKPAYN